jgi:hypothetical protein
MAVSQAVNLNDKRSHQDLKPAQIQELYNS